MTPNGTGCSGQLGDRGRGWPTKTYKGGDFPINVGGGDGVVRLWRAAGAGDVDNAGTVATEPEDDSSLGRRRWTTPAIWSDGDGRRRLGRPR